MKRRPLTDAPERLLPEQRARIRDWVQAHYPQLELGLPRHWQDCRDWHLSNGVLRACWEATFRKWLRKAIEIEARTQDERHKARGVTLRLFRGGRE